MVSGISEIDTKAKDVIENTLIELTKESSLHDSLKLKDPYNVQQLYKQNSFQPLWSSGGSFISYADSLLSFIGKCRNYGLFPEDYYANQISELHTELTSAPEKKFDASQWSFADLLMTSAFVQAVKDLKTGRLLGDSTMIKDTTLNADFFWNRLKMFQKTPVTDFAAALEPKNKDYGDLKKALQSFLAKANFRNYSVIKLKDSLSYRKVVYKRLTEEDSIKIPVLANPDSASVVSAIKKYEALKKMKVDGKITSTLIKKLNDNDKEKFLRIAITLDRYKTQSPPPDEYILVNLPSFYLQLRKGDSVSILSRIICGKPATSTPFLASNITDIVTYPQWTIPESIIKKEILPGLKRDAGYTGRKGYSILDSKGNEVDPLSINWAKYKENIPYKVIQGSGDANALGVLKFNFPNLYSVYLHDTNQRYLFSNSNRALSHGCVRVQEWKKLAYYLLKRDLAATPKATSLDSLNSWLSQKKKHVIAMHKQMPIFIRYFTCVAKDGKIIFYDDIYDDDKKLRDKIFADK